MRRQLFTEDDLYRPGHPFQKGRTQVMTIIKCDRISCDQEHRGDLPPTGWFVMSRVGRPGHLHYCSPVCVSVGAAEYMRDRMDQAELQFMGSGLQ